GDLGRRGLPYLRDAAPVPASDLLLCECTYGGRRHDTAERLAEKVEAGGRRTAGRGGKVRVPALDRGRTQLGVPFLLRRPAGARRPLRVYVDSPLAADVAEVCCRYPEYFSPESRFACPEEEGCPGCRGVRYIRSAEESEWLGERRDPCIVVASGGMCEGGRI